MGGLLPTSCLARGDQGGAECGAPTFNITPPQMEFCNKCTDPNGAKYTIYKIQTAKDECVRMPNLLQYFSKLRLELCLG